MHHTPPRSWALLGPSFTFIPHPKHAGDTFSAADSAATSCSRSASRTNCKTQGCRVQGLALGVCDGSVKLNTVISFKHFTP